MIDRDHDLPVSHQARLLGISRGTVYYQAQEVSQDDLKLIRRIDELHQDYPFAGSRMLRDMLRHEGFMAGRRHVRTLMHRMGVQAIYRKPNTSKKHPGHKVYPYLLRELAIDRANQVWAMDITYVPMAKGWVYLTVVLDWYSRKVLAWRLSIFMDVDFCIESMQEAIARWGCPEIFNTDQGSQFTSQAFTQMLKHHGIAISMDGKGCWRDNVFVERLWRSVKYEEVYLKAYENVTHARQSLGKYLDFYNRNRPHSTHAASTPETVYFESLPAITRQRSHPERTALIETGLVFKLPGAPLPNSMTTLPSRTS